MFSFTAERGLFMLMAFLSHDLPLFIYQVVISYFRANGIFKQYLIQPQETIPPELHEKATKRLLIGHLGTQWIFLYFVYDLFSYLGVAPLSSEVNWFELFYFIPFMVICDTTLYWVHRTLHHPLLYVTFHKQHHEFHSNEPISSEYFSVTEEAVTGLLPTLLGPMLFRPHTLIIMLWISFRICESADAHCGYDFPFSIFRLGRPGDRHDFHHSNNKGSFAAFFTFWDRICGTDEPYLTFKKKQLEEKKKA